MKSKPIVTDTYDFPTLIEGGYVYVDKTALKQVEAKGYAKPYSTDTRKIVAVGVNYNIKSASVEILAESVSFGSVNEPVNSLNEPVNEPVTQRVLALIKEQPGLRRPNLLKLVPVSEATMKRALAALISERRVEFRGAPKNGGYYCIEGDSK